jgi:hypothetical protein
MSYWPTIQSGIGKSRFVLTIARSPRFSGSLRQKLAVQGRYKVNLFLCVLTGSVQGVAERPLPCSYNVIRLVCALSRRRRGFKSSRGRQINNLREKCLLSV